LMIDRDPCNAIRPEDDELLRKLAGIHPSKVLVSSRLVPRVLLNKSNQPITGVKRIPLEGLKPADAEAMIRACEVTGNSTNIQNYLKTNCDCHPLVIGALAGLINNYLPDRGNFEAWANDPDEGAKLNLAELDLVQRRNHILSAALENLPEKSKQMMATLSLLVGSINFETLKVFNPHNPNKPEAVKDPDDDFFDEDKEEVEAKEKYRNYQTEYENWLKRTLSNEFNKQLTETILDLEKRGLLQYDGSSKHYDLHPVVRGVALGTLNQEEKENYGNLVIDHFSSKPHSPYDEVKMLEELDSAIQIMTTYLQLKEYKKAFQIYEDLSKTLLFNLEEYDLILSLLRPFCNNGLMAMSTLLDEKDGALLLNNISASFYYKRYANDALTCEISVLKYYIRRKIHEEIPVTIRNIALLFLLQKRLYLIKKDIDISLILDDKENIFMSHLHYFRILSQQGKWEEADKIWIVMNPMERNWDKNSYRQGDADCEYAYHLFRQNKLEITFIQEAIQICQQFNTRFSLRVLYGLKGEWFIEQGEYKNAIELLQLAISMAHEVRLSDTRSEILLAMAKWHLGQLEEPLKEVERLEEKGVSHQKLAELWLLIGDKEKSEKYALEAYKGGWAEGEPYVYRYQLNKATALLHELGVEIPNLPPFDESKIVIEDWEIELDKYIEELRAEKEKEKNLK
jgi:hypothetical protein